MKPTTKNSPAVKVGAGKNNGSGADYAPPHKMSGERISPKTDSFVTRDPNTLKAAELGPGKAVMRVSMGDPAANDVKTDGIKMRGAGAAERGFMSRGPMA
jgi:hypothetical protein